MQTVEYQKSKMSRHTISNFLEHSFCLFLFSLLFRYFRSSSTHIRVFRTSNDSFFHSTSDAFDFGRKFQPFFLRLFDERENDDETIVFFRGLMLDAKGLHVIGNFLRVFLAPEGDKFVSIVLFDAFKKYFL